MYFLLVVPILLGPLAGQAKTLKSPCPHTSPQTLFVIQKPPARLGIVECSLRLMLRRSPVRSTGAWAITMLTGAWVRGCGTCVTISNPAASTKQFLLLTCFLWRITTKIPRYFVQDVLVLRRRGPPLGPSSSGPLLAHQTRTMSILHPLPRRFLGRLGRTKI